jgi:hypothetical protein
MAVALTDKDWDRSIKNSHRFPNRPTGRSPASIAKSPPSLKRSPITSPAFFPKTSEIERLHEIANALKRKSNGPGFSLEPSTAARKGPAPVVHDYSRWIPLVRAEQDNGRERFRKRLLAEVIVPRCVDLYDDKGELLAAHEAEIAREWEKTAAAYQRQRKDAELRRYAAKEPVSVETLLDSLRALPIKNVVIMLDSACNQESVNLDAMEAAEKIILEERGDEIDAERARQQHAFEVAEGIAPAPKRQASEVGPFGETADTHDIVYENVKSGAGKGQTVPLRTWVPKSKITPVAEDDLIPYSDSWHGIDWGN